MSRRSADGKNKPAAVLRQEFNEHHCTPVCLILKSEARLAGIESNSLSLAEVQKARIDLNLCTESKKRKSLSLYERPRKRIRPSPPEQSSSEATSGFPVFLSQDEKDQIVREFRQSTNNSALKRYECSFCGKYEVSAACRVRATAELDISVLENAIVELQERSRQPCIQSFNPLSLINDAYVLCHLCNTAVSKNSFQSIPVRSYANGLWIGTVPDELKDLTFLEEQCIARARATKCMYKLALGPSGQFAARGNVCILPQDTSSFVASMPVPLSVLHDEICVILVASADAEITHDMLRKTPLLIRREKVRTALFWLIEHNPLYADLDKDAVIENSEDYP
ncbi:hypothetical protein R3P38DRAFT_2588239, partial [Favolaschia claudopus]